MSDVRVESPEHAASSFPFDLPVVWEPDPESTAASNLQRFMDRHGIESYDALLKRSVDDVSWFWSAVLEDLGVEFYTPFTQILDVERGAPLARWCVGGEMNIVHNCVDKWQETKTRTRDAIRWEGEDGSLKTLSYADLHHEVCRCANALRELGLGKGDVVALYMPMIPEIVVAFLAVIKIGGIVLPLFSGYGSAAVASRLNGAGARALVTANAFHRRGRPVAMKIIADEALVDAPTVKTVIVVDRLELAEEGPWTDGRDHWWHDLVPRQSGDAPTECTAAEDPLMLIYTSGTTGQAKAAVHTHCGFPIKAAQDMVQSMDLRTGEVMYWMTDMGWMMGPWLVFGTLLAGATMVLYDGAPDHPEPDRLWQLVSDHEVTHLGISPTLIRALRTHGEALPARHDLSALRAVCSTGSPWDPDSWLWLFDKVLDRRVPILNYSGGTEISGGILCGNFFRPLKPCAFSGPVPGMDADVVNDEGKPVRGVVGELVIRQPWIGMTRGFWKDEKRYLETYWSRFEGLWLHGDFAAIDRDGLWYILGRSDDTVKVAGKRVGPAEVEAIINENEAVAECAAIGVPDEVKGQALVVFCVLRDGFEPTDTLRSHLRERVAAALGKPLCPRQILFTAALPKTRNAKLMRRLIRSAYLGDAPGDMSSLEDPSTIEAIRGAV